MTEEEMLAKREKAMNIALSLCEGRKEDDDDINAYDAAEICAEAEIFYQFLIKLA